MIGLKTTPDNLVYDRVKEQLTILYMIGLKNT